MFDLDFDENRVCLTLKQPNSGLLQRLIATPKKRDLKRLSPNDRDLIIAIADLRALAQDDGEELELSSDRLRLSHRLAAALSGEAAQALGLPQLVELTLRTDAEGIVGSPNFRLKAQWFKNGQLQLPRRTGSILETSNGLRRLPLWLMEALDVAEAFPPEGSDIDHWNALARFRQALDPGVRVGDANHAAKVSMTDFLSGLEVRVADRLSISANEEGDDFDVLPFSRQRLDERGEETISESDSELAGNDLRAFQDKVRERGALPAYRLRAGSFLVVDRSALPALEVMTEIQRASPAERAAFIRNPRPRVTEAVEAALRKEGRLDRLSPEAEEEAIEAVAGPVFIETREFSDRVTGVKLFEKPDLGAFEPSGTTWLPEQFARQIAEVLSNCSKQELETIRDDVEQAIKQGRDAAPFGELSLPARPEMVSTINDYLDKAAATSGGKDDEKQAESKGPIVLDGRKNFDEIGWLAKYHPRRALIATDLPRSIRTTLKPHQIESFRLQVEAWRAGLPGLLNADEQGLGKTLQTIAFLVWLKSHMALENAAQRGPVLVVAPTSLLENWEQEVARHVEEPGLGHLIRLYGSAVSSRKMTGKAGRDIDSGEMKLDFGFLEEAIEEGRAHRFWMLTTYTTLTNYQHSLGRIPFSALVFDEIQTLKNPASLCAQAGLFVKADFRIGLTGTPIENSTIDLWAVMEQLAPGALGSFTDFRKLYREPDADNMAKLHSLIFRPIAGRPPLAFRRTKDQVARDLPEKSRCLHPRLMPPVQAAVYDDARLKLARGGRGAALKALHHIRSVSVHPSLDEKAPDEDFIAGSARLSATFDILRRIQASGERALVFIEHRQMQYRFIELARAEFGLSRIDLINGDTPIPRRQAIVDRFQRHLQDDLGFDILVLGPKAAGVGLTLTAATHVIHLSRWWNPAVEEQCNDRVHRIGQTRPVHIHLPIAIHARYRENSFDCLLQSLIQRKRKLANSALWPMGDTEADVADLQQMLNSAKIESAEDPVSSTMHALFQRDGMPPPVPNDDGSVSLF